MTVQEMDRLVITKTVEVLIAAGAVLSVNDGDDHNWAIKNSTDWVKVVDAITAVDDAMLSVRGAVSGWVRFIMGNDGYDVINDYSTRLDEVLGPVVLGRGAAGGAGVGSERDGDQGRSRRHSRRIGHRL